MIGFFSNMFGYILNFIYNLVQNYGVAIILFSILIKLAMLPMSIKQQKTMKKTAKIQGKVKEIQNKYKNDPEKMNREVMDLYKKENMSPFSGCLSVIVQMILLFAMFYLVRSPLTHMRKIDTESLENYKNEIVQEYGDEKVSKSYPEISIIRNANEKGNEDSEFYINMNFLGLDLSNVPQENYKNLTVYIIPILYVISSMISIKLTTQMNAKKEEKKDIVIDKEGKKEEDVDMAAQMNKSMAWMMPIMSVSISLIAPLGLALYWLLNNVLMIIEKVILNKVLTEKEEEKIAE